MLTLLVWGHLSKNFCLQNFFWDFVKKVEYTEQLSHCLMEYIFFVSELVNYGDQSFTQRLRIQMSTPDYFL
jgi:hypothetical protein